MDKASVSGTFGWRASVFAAFLIATAAATEALGQTERSLYEDYDTQIKGSEHVGVLGPEFFGDSTDFNSGATTFSVTDVSLPGNSELPVALQRSFRAYDDGINAPQTQFSPNWTTFEVPYLSGIYKRGQSHLDDTGWRSGHSHPDNLNRCSISTGPPEVEQSAGKEDLWEQREYWHGNHLFLPGGDQQPLRVVPSSDPSHPDDGSTYRWATYSHWHFSCLPTTKNAAGGEGFLGIAPDGTRYWFDWLVEWRTAPTLEKEAWIGGPTLLYRAEYRLLVTRIEDRHGNWVNYSYSGKNLTQITANDGRTLTLTYDSIGGRLASVSDGSRTWTYDFTNGVEVTFPDSTVWRSYVTGPGITRGVLNSCFDEQNMFTGENTLTIQARTGAVASFLFKPLRRGTSYTSWRTGHDCPTTRAYIDNIALYSKTISGPGLAPSTWSITYGPHNGCYTERGSECTTGSPTTRYVDVHGPGPTFVRYTFGNKWRDNVGVLLRIRTGTSISNILRDQTLTWETFDGPGYSTGGGYMAATTRREKTRTILQQGATYTTTSSNWDEFYNPQTVTESGPNGGSRTTDYTYYNNESEWVVGKVASRTSPGTNLSRTFNANGNLSSETRNGVATSYNYHADGNIATISYPRALVHSFSSYKLGIPRSESQPDGIQITRTVNNQGYLTSVANGEGHTIAFTYDVMGRATAVDFPRGNDATLSHTPLRTTFTRGVLVEITNFDGLRRLIQTESGGIATNYEYDAYGRRTFESNPGATIGTRHEYDALGRVKKITTADGSYRTHQYPAASVIVRDEHGNETTHLYRAYGDPDSKVLIQITAPIAAANVSVSRLPNDLISGITQGGFTRTFTYDSRNYLKSETHPEIGTINYGLDAAGNITSKTIGGAQTTYSYDGHNREITTSYPDASPDVTKTFTRTGKLKLVSTTTAARAFTYDANDNLTQESVTVDGRVLTAQYSYNGNDQLATISYPVSATVVAFTPDVLGRPTEVSGYVTGISYWPSSLPNEITYANGVVTEYEQNSRLWPSAFHTRRGSGNYLSSSYQYDPTGNLTSIVDSVEPDMNRTLSYDAISRLTGANGPWGPGTIAYDGAGNITNQSLGSFTLSYSYDSQNRLASISGGLPKSYSYDGRGNVTTSGGKSFVYDAAPNLVCANCGEAGEVTYAYDGLQKRVKVTKSGATTYEFHSTNGDLLVAHTPSEANKLTEYFYVAGKRIAQRVANDNPPTTITPVETTLLADQNGSVTIAVSVGGTSPGGTVGFTRQGASLGSDFVSGGTASIEVSGLASTTHSITARYSGDESNSGNSLDYQIQVIDRKPPSITVPASSTTGDYTISWGTATAPVDTYELYESTNANFSGQTKVYDGSGSSIQLPSRQDGTYYYRVRGCDATGCSGYRTGSNPIEVLLPPGIPSTIGYPSASTTGNYTVSWSTASGFVSSYRLYVATSSSFSDQWLIHTSIGNITGKAIPGQDNGTYYYRVKACNASGCSGYRSGSHAITVTKPPTVPSSINVPSSSNTGTYTISWGSSLGTLTAYKLYEADNSSFSGQVLAYSGTARSRQIPGKSTGHYYYRVRACNGSSCSGYRTGANRITVTLPPARPASISGPAQNYTGNYSISWSSSSGATRYELWESRFGAPFSKVYDGQNTFKSFSGKPAGEYTYKVKACNAGGCSAFSSTHFCMVCKPQCL